MDVILLTLNTEKGRQKSLNAGNLQKLEKVRKQTLPAARNEHSFASTLVVAQ